MKKGKIITISGLDRTGKTTQSKLLANSLDAIYMKFPTNDTYIGKILRSILNDNEISLHIKGNEPTEFQKIKSNCSIFQALNIVNKIEKQEEINDILNSGKNIIMDRYDIDAYVYGTQDGCNESWNRQLVTLLKPSDICIYFNGPQLNRDDKKDMYEDNSLLMENVKKHFDLIFSHTEKYSKILNIPILTTFHSNGESIEYIQERFLKFTMEWIDVLENVLRR